MNLLLPTGIALSSIRRNKVRAFLTVLGIVIGVSAVIGMVHVGEGTKAQIREQIESLGANLLMVRAGSRRGPGGSRTRAPAFDVKDARAIADQVAGVDVAPTNGASATLVYGNTNWPTSVTGTDNHFFSVRDWELASGRRFETGELQSAAPVCVLGQTVVKELFGGADPVGERLRVDKLSCLVIGTLQSKESTFGGDPDDLVVMPLRTVQRRLSGDLDIGMIYVSATIDGTSARVQSDIERLLRERRRIGPGAADDFRVWDTQQTADRAESAAGMMVQLLGIIAAVSLLVGGIGIMNIMLVSVTERTREIGIRMAIGARGKEVMAQFLVEAVVLSTLGGVIGIGLGLGGSYIATKELDMPFVLVPGIITVAFFFSAGVGILFGFVPARKASRLDPIEALRHE